MDDEFSFAPGEGQIPIDILKEDNWDIKTWPHLHPNGLYGLHHPGRETKLTNLQYFQQRILNWDNRFSKNPSFVYAAVQFIEKQQLNRNVNISFMRGKKTKNIDGTSSYSLDDGFSVLDKISNTPRYWSTAKMEFIAKLENNGPFQFFNTLSCADMRYDENFTTFLRDNPNLKIVYETNLDETDINFEKVFVVDKVTMEKVSLEKYLKDFLGQSKHETLRLSVLTAT